MLVRPYYRILGTFKVDGKDGYAMGIWLAGCPCSTNEDFLEGPVSRPRVVRFPAAWPGNTCPLWRTSASLLAC